MRRIILILILLLSTTASAWYNAQYNFVKNYQETYSNKDTLDKLDYLYVDFCIYDSFDNQFFCKDDSSSNIYKITSLTSSGDFDYTTISTTQSSYYNLMVTADNLFYLYDDAGDLKAKKHVGKGTTTVTYNIDNSIDSCATDSSYIYCLAYDSVNSETNIYKYDNYFTEVASYTITDYDDCASKIFVADNHVYVTYCNLSSQMAYFIFDTSLNKLTSKTDPSFWISAGEIVKYNTDWDSFYLKFSVSDNPTFKITDNIVDTNYASGSQIVVTSTKVFEYNTVDNEVAVIDASDMQTVLSSCYLDSSISYLSDYVIAPAFANSVIFGNKLIDYDDCAVLDTDTSPFTFDTCVEYDSTNEYYVCYDKGYAEIASYHIYEQPPTTTTTTSTTTTSTTTSSTTSTSTSTSTSTTTTTNETTTTSTSTTSTTTSINETTTSIVYYQEITTTINTTQEQRDKLNKTLDKMYNITNSTELNDIMNEVTNLTPQQFEDLGYGESEEKENVKEYILYFLEFFKVIIILIFISCLIKVFRK